MENEIIQMDGSIFFFFENTSSGFCWVFWFFLSFNSSFLDERTENKKREKERRD